MSKSIKFGLKLAAVFWSVTLASALLFANTVFAEGLHSRPRIASPYQPPAAAPVAAFNWTGVYVGAGVGWQQFNFDPEYGSSEEDDFFFGELKVGGDMRLGSSRFVAGVFGTWTPEMLTSKDGIDNIYSVGGRLGFLPTDDSMLYAGGAWLRAEGFNTSADGYRVIAGFEKQLWLNTTWAVEYNYSDLDVSNADLTAHAVIGRLNIRFGMGN